MAPQAHDRRGEETSGDGSVVTRGHGAKDCRNRPAGSTPRRDSFSINVSPCRARPCAPSSRNPTDTRTSRRRPNSASASRRRRPSPLAGTRSTRRPSRPLLPSRTRSARASRAPRRSSRYVQPCSVHTAHCPRPHRPSPLSPAQSPSDQSRTTSTEVARLPGHVLEAHARVNAQALNHAQRALVSAQTRRQCVHRPTIVVVPLALAPLSLHTRDGRRSGAQAARKGGGRTPKGALLLGMRGGEREARRP